MDTLSDGTAATSLYSDVNQSRTVSVQDTGTTKKAATGASCRGFLCMFKWKSQYLPS